MRKWGIALAALGLLAGGARAADTTFVPVDTTRNLAAPVPYYGPAMEKKSFFGRVGDSIKSVSPFHVKKTLARPPAPIMPTAAPVAGLIGKAANKASSLLSPTAGFSGAAR